MWLQLVIEVLVSVVVVRAATARQLFPLTPLLCPSKHGKRCAASRHMLVSCVRDFLLALVFWAVVHTRCRHAGTSVSTADEEGGGGAAADRGIIIFLIERSWDPSVPYGEGGDCTSGGFNHASRLITAFFEFANFFSRTRRPVMLAPRFILEPMHDVVPLSTRWGDWFDWDVDSNEFRTPEDVRDAYRANPDRFQFFDIYDPAGTVRGVEKSTAEIVVVHMYGVPGQACYTNDPMQELAAAAKRVERRSGVERGSVRNPTYVPSSYMTSVARQVVDSLGGPFQFTSVHVRRGDVLTLESHTYDYHFSGKELRIATSPDTIAKIFTALVRPGEPVVLFSNEKNRTFFNGLKEQFHPQLRLFSDILAALPEADRLFFEDGYSEYILAHSVVPQSRLHICTVDAKLGAACGSSLVQLIPGTDGLAMAVTSF